MMSSTESSPSSQSSRTREKRIGGSKRGPIWDHYDEVTTDANGQSVMRCQECSKEFKHPSKASTLTYHWKNLHAEKEQPANKLGNSRDDDQPKSKKSRIQDALTDVLAIPAYPINMFLHPVVRKFFAIMNPKIEFPRSFETLKSLLVSKCNAVQKMTKKALEGIRNKPSITCDCWTDKSMKHSYLGITLHFIDKNTAIRRLFLGLKELEGSHTGFLLRRKTEELLAEYGLKMENVYKVVTDSGSNILSAFKDVLLLDANCDWAEEDEIIDNEEFDDNEAAGLEVVESLIKVAFPIRIRCFAHCLQLVILNFFAAHVNNQDSFKKMRLLINKFHHSPSATKELSDSTGLTLLVPITIRWASYILVIAQFLEVHDVVANIAATKKWNAPTADEIQFLRCVHKLSSVLVEVLCRIQGKKYVTISSCLGYFKAMKRGIGKMKDVQETKEMAETLGRLLDNRFSWMVDAFSKDFDPIYLMAAALDPNTSRRLSKLEFEHAVRELQPFVDWQPSDQSESSASREGSVLDCLLREIDEDEKQKRHVENGVHSGAEIWIGEILKQGIAVQAASKTPIDALKYWSNFLGSEYKSVAILALDVLAVSATSASIERIFSLAGLATRNQRNRTEINLLNSQLVVFCNRLVD